MSGTAPRSAKEERRREILEAAFEEISKKGYAGASMEAIARRARASKETLYAWFENKETLFATLLETRLTDMANQVAIAAEGDLSPAHMLPIVAENTIRLMLAIEPLAQALGASGPSDRAQRLAGKAITDERKRFAAYLLRCRDQGYIAFDDDPLELVSLFVAMAEGEWSMRLATGMIEALTDQMIAAHAQRVTRLFLKGLAPEPRP